MSGRLGSGRGFRTFDAVSREEMAQRRTPQADRLPVRQARLTAGARSRGVEGRPCAATEGRKPAGQPRPVAEPAERRLKAAVGSTPDIAAIILSTGNRL